MQTINMQLENGNQAIINIFKNIAKEMGAKLKINKPQLTENGFTEEFEKELDKSIKEFENGEYTSYESIEELRRDIL